MCVRSCTLSGVCILVLCTGDSPACERLSMAGSLLISDMRWAADILALAKLGVKELASPTAMAPNKTAEITLREEVTLKIKQAPFCLGHISFTFNI